MADLYDTILQEIKDRCPNINWKLGGLLRELLVEPVKVMQEEVSKYINTVLASVDLNAALENPVDNISTINAWMDRLGIQVPEPKDSHGEVTIIVTTTDTLIVPESASFLCADWRLTTNQAYTFTAKDFKELIGGVYAVTVPVTINNGVAVNIVEGTAVTWGSAPKTVSDMYISSAVTGGLNSLTPQAKASLISATLNNKTLVGDASISSALVRTFPESVINAVSRKGLAGSVDRVGLFVKQRSMPTSKDFTCKVYTDVGSGSLYSFVTAYGIVSINSVTSVAGKSIPFTVDWKSSSVTQLRLDFAAGSVVADSEVVVSASCFADLPEIFSWLNAEQRAMPFGFSCKSPAVAQVKLAINTGGVELDAAAQTSIQDYICDKPLDSTITDTEISGILSAMGYSVHGAILYSASIQYQEYKDVCSSSGVFSPTGQLGLVGAPVALYCSAVDIKGY